MWSGGARLPARRGLDSVWIHDSYFERDAVTYASAIASQVTGIRGTGSDRGRPGPAAFPVRRVAGLVGGAGYTAPPLQYNRPWSSAPTSRSPRR